MTDTDVKSTPLAAKHVELGARMVPFASWNMPVQYTGILDEHKAVRETCGIFDISHMGQFTVAGDSAAAWLNSMLTNDINKLNVGQGQYSVMLNDRAGVVDDLLLYRMEPEIPASRRKGRISLYAAPAIQGKMVLNSSARLRKASNGLKPFLEQEPNPAAWAPATVCVWKCAIL